MKPTIKNRMKKPKMTLATFLTEQKKHKEFKKVCKSKGLQMSVVFNNAMNEVLTEHANKSNK